MFAEVKSVTISSTLIYSGVQKHILYYTQCNNTYFYNSGIFAILFCDF